MLKNIILLFLFDKPISTMQYLPIAAVSSYEVLFNKV